MHETNKMHPKKEGKEDPWKYFQQASDKNRYSKEN